MPLQLAFIALAACPLAAGCVGAAIEPVPVADATRLDEQAALSVELAYQAAALAVLTADRAHLIPDRMRQDIRRVDAAAFEGVKAVRRAYDAGNAAAYSDAQRTARAAIKRLMRAV